MQESTVYRSIQEEAKAEARAEAEARTKREIAIGLLREGFPIEAIARGTGLSIPEVQQLQQQLDSPAQN